jgi:FkbM family methyltransferase
LLTARKIRSKLRRLNPWRFREHVHKQVAKREVCGRIRELVVGDILLRVDEFQGEFYVDPKSDLAVRVLSDGWFEPRLASIALQVVDAERDVVDVGANIGFYTVLLAKKLGRGRRVAAFEPDEDAFEKLNRNVRHNKVGEMIITLPYGASNSSGSAALYHVPGRSEYSSLSPIVHPSATGDLITSRTISTVTVDEVTLKYGLRPAFLKIDAEGSEHLVLEGSHCTIKRHRPVILMEVSDNLLRPAGSSADAVIGTVKSYDYIIIDPIKPRLRPGSRAFGDIICFPREDHRWRTLVRQ